MSANAAPYGLASLLSLLDRRGVLILRLLLREGYEEGRTKIMGKHVILKSSRWVSPILAFDTCERLTRLRGREIGERLH